MTGLKKAYKCVTIKIDNDDVTLRFDPVEKKVVEISKPTECEVEEVNAKITRLYYRKVAPPRRYHILYKVEFNGVIAYVIQTYDGTTASSISFSLWDSHFV